MKYAIVSSTLSQLDLPRANKDKLHESSPWLAEMPQTKI
jgi:hypothetical protein